MENMSHSSGHVTRSKVGAVLAAAIGLIAIASLAGCSSSASTPKVTVTITPTAPTPSATMPGPASPGPEPEPEPQPNPPEPNPPDPNPPANPDGVTLSLSKGSVSPGCTSSTCWYPYLEWTGLDVGNHQVQCVSSAIGAWSSNTMKFETADGERELLCYVGYPGSTVYVVIDGVYESNHVDW
jgi:hypothetical protein